MAGPLQRPLEQRKRRVAFDMRHRRHEQPVALRQFAQAGGDAAVRAVAVGGYKSKGHAEEGERLEGDRQPL